MTGGATPRATPRTPRQAALSSAWSSMGMDDEASQGTLTDEGSAAAEMQLDVETEQPEMTEQKQDEHAHEQTEQQTDELD